MAANDAFFTNMKVPKLRKFVKERDIQIFNSRKCLHDLFSFEVFGAYMQVLMDVTTRDDRRHSTSFLVSLRPETGKS